MNQLVSLPKVFYQILQTLPFYLQSHLSSIMQLILFGTLLYLQLLALSYAIPPLMLVGVLWYLQWLCFKGLFKIVFNHMLTKCKSISISNIDKTNHNLSYLSQFLQYTAATIEIIDHILILTKSKDKGDPSTSVPIPPKSEKENIQ